MTNTSPAAAPIATTEDVPTFPVINFCTTHREPMLPLSDETIRLEVGEKGLLDRSRHPNVLNCYEEAPATRSYRAEFAIVCGLLTASRYLRRNNIGNETVVNFMSYRLFIMPHQTKHYKVPMQMNHLTPEEVLDYRTYVSPQTAEKPFRLPRYFDGLRVEKSYVERHGDGFFELFVRSTIGAGVLNEEEAHSMANNALHLTAMGVGWMPAGVFCDVSDVAEIAVMRFLQDHADKASEEGRFQFVLYLYERLAIYLMELELRKRYKVIPRDAFGVWTMVGDERNWVPGKLEIN